MYKVLYMGSIPFKYSYLVRLYTTEQQQIPR